MLPIVAMRKFQATHVIHLTFLLGSKMPTRLLEYLSQGSEEYAVFARGHISSVSSASRHWPLSLNLLHDRLWLYDRWALTERRVRV